MKLKLIAGAIFLFSMESSVGMTEYSAKSSNDGVFLPVLSKKENKSDLNAKRDISVRLEEINENLSNQINEIKKEISTILYCIQKFGKQISEIKLYETQKQINEIRRMIFDLQQQAMCQSQGLDMTNERINETNQRLNKVENVIAVMSRHFMQSAICPVPLGFNSMTPIYHPIPQGVVFQPPSYPMPQQLIPEQQKPINQPLP